MLVVVVAIVEARAPQRPVGRRRVVEAGDELRQPVESRGGQGGDVAVGNGELIAGRLAAGGADVAQLGDRQMRHAGKARLPEGDGGFERQLRAQAAGDVARLGRAARLVVGDDEAAAAMIDAVGARRERERPGRRRDDEIAADLGEDARNAVASRRLGVGEPLGEAFKARQPERGDARVAVVVGEDAAGRCPSARRARRPARCRGSAAQSGS